MVRDRRWIAQRLRFGPLGGIVGLGGLGHMGVKFAHAFGAHVVLFTTSLQAVHLLQIAAEADVDAGLLERADIALRGQHNLENVLAAAGAAFLAGAEPAAIAAGVRSFPGVEHRLEFVAEIAGVSFFNDSKATNVDATLKAIEAFPGRLFVILGGQDKGSDYAPLAEPLRRRAREVLLIGAAAEKISAQLSPAPAEPPAFPIEQAGTLDRAVALAFAHARPGDTVLLAPACASFDQFQNFEHRGRLFKQYVHALGAAHAQPAAANQGSNKG